MEINGKKIALEIYGDLRSRVLRLKEQGIQPHLVVILIGDDSASVAYVNQKKKWSEYIGVLFSLVHYPASVRQEEVDMAVEHINADPSVHGIIIQRPVPQHINQQKLLQIVSSEKDVDGFHPNSPFEVPVAQAVWRILEEISREIPNHPYLPKTSFLKWLNSKSIFVIGKGETAGGPIIRLLQKKGLRPTIIDSKTENREQLLKQADIVISAVGRPGMIQKNQLKKDVILIGVGLRKNDRGILEGDFYEKEIQEVASTFTPTPGGVGPINVAYLLANVVTAAENKKATN